MHFIHSLRVSRIPSLLLSRVRKVMPAQVDDSLRDGECITGETISCIVYPAETILAFGCVKLS